MRKELFQTIDIPEGVEVNINDNEIIVKGNEGELKREFSFGKLNVDKKDNQLVIGFKQSTKKEKKSMNTIIAHIKNMINGVQNKFEYKLKICSGHFPMTVKVDGKTALVKNFLGGKIDKKVDLLNDVDVDIKGQDIILKSKDKELAGQVAANFEKSTRITNKDRRIFQDGIFIVNKAGREI